MTPPGGPRAFICGAGGLLGRHLVSTLPQLGYTLGGSARGRTDLDIADAAAVDAHLDACTPSIVFNAAAYTDVDGAEDDADRCRRANVDGPAVLARACAARGLRLVHYSTDFVFDGESEQPYDEDATPSPRGSYARSKRDGELQVLAAHPRAQVVRVGCLYGHGGRNFPSRLLGRLRAGEAIVADDERRVSPTWVVEVAALSGRLGLADARGLFHATAAGDTTWAAFARAMASAAGLSSRVTGVTAATLALKAPRPRRAVLVSHRLAEHGLSPLPPWPSQLSAYLGAEGVPVLNPSGNIREG
jgi:dTDP-4-dehydrorhamnose reductase